MVTPAADRMAARRERARAAGLCITCCRKRPEHRLSVCTACAKQATRRSLDRRNALRSYRRFRAIIEAHEQAGDVARASHFYEGAAKHFQDALNVGATDPSDRLRISEKLAQVLFLCDHVIDANLSLTQQNQMDHRSGLGGAQMFGILQQRVRQLIFAYKNHEALPVIKEAIRIAAGIGDPAFLKRAKLMMVHHLERLGRYDEADHYLNTIGEVGDDCDPALQVSYHMRKAIISSAFGKAEETYENFERAIDAANGDADAYRITAVWKNYGRCAMSLGNIDLAKACTERALLISRHEQIAWRTPYLCLSYADVLTRMGEHEIGYRYVLEAISYRSQTHALDAPLAEIGVPLVLRMGDKSVLAECIRPSIVSTLFRSGSPDDIGLVAAAFAQLYHSQGHLRKARALLHRALQVVYDVDLSWDFPLEIARRGSLSDIPHARKLLEKRAALPAANVARAYLSLFDAYNAQRSGDSERAVFYASDAASRFELLHWHAYADEARSLGVPEHADDERRNITHRRKVLRSHVSLTSREKEVAQLALEGRTNYEIAQTLSIEKRTVEAHMTSIMNRLGIRSRHQLVEIAKGGWVGMEVGVRPEL